MRMESVLRQLTFSMVSFVPFLLEYDSSPPPEANGNGVPIVAAVAKPTVSDVVLSDVVSFSWINVFSNGCSALYFSVGRNSSCTILKGSEMATSLPAFLWHTC